MNRYDELVNWLHEEHNEVFNQWAQIEEELDIEETRKRMEERAKQIENARKDWDEKKAMMQAFLESEDSNELNEDLKKAIQFNLDIVGKEFNGQIIEALDAWTAIRALMSGRPNSPIRRGE